jgi:sporulation protein YlmC with PRC-barrel domain
VLGAKVRLKAKPEDRAEAAAEGKVAKGPNGSVDDLIVDCKSGQATWAVVSVGGLLGIGDKEVAVPAAALLPTGPRDKPMFELDATEAELKSLPAFDKKAMEKTGLDVSLQNAEASWKKIRPDARVRAPVDASGRRNPVDATHKEGAVVNATGAVLGSRIKGMKVRCSDGKEAKSFGEIDSVAIDRNTHTISYVVIGKGGVLGIGETDYLVPWGATNIITVEQKPVVTVAKSSTEVENATKYQKPKEGFLGDENCKASCQYWGVEHGKMHARDKDGDGR